MMPDRKKNLQDISSQTYDLLIVGGGITGAGIALDAASRGLKVLLLEAQDFAFGTSSRSTKLIHGGLRYLKQGEVALVREVGTERAIVHRNAPHLVVPEKMLLPLITEGTYGYWATSAGLFLYDMLAKVKMSEWRIMLNKKETIDREPLLRSDILKGAGYYAEYRTDDARLVIEIVKTAQKYGATLLNYVKVEDFTYKNQKITGAFCKDQYGQQDFYVKAKNIVNATGPWADEGRKKDNSLQGKRLHLTKGVHLVVPHYRLPLQQAIYFDVPDGRMIFAIPRGNSTYIGTTDTNYKGDIAHPNVSQDDAEYLLESTNFMFPDVQLTLEDVQSSWAGLRPLIHEDGKLPSELSRKDEIFIAPSGLITIAGGKLTGYRKMAEKVVNMIVKEITETSKQRLPKCFTQDIRLEGGLFENFTEVVQYRENLWKKYKQLSIEEEDIHYLVHNYGKQSEIILQTFQELNTENNNNDIALHLLKAELLFCLKNEMVLMPADFLMRRTGRMYFDMPTVKKYYVEILHYFGIQMQWTEAKIAQETTQIQLLIEELELKNLKNKHN
ncbi:MAG: glycerol-3-phosphate dehydrogenase/oxidase [Cytophagales bacterium]|nr:MAG: glycerol-3-phosphate dehydrogenase/oxidase [Cytophagales bacterium]